MRKDPFGNPLLPRMHYKHSAYWYVYRNKWTPLGKNYETAYREYGALRFAGAGSMVDLIKKTYAQYEGKAKSGEIKESTLRSYKAVRTNLMTAFQNMEAREVKPAHIKQFNAHYYPASPNVANRALVVLREVFELGMDLAQCDTNPARMVKRKVESKRTRRLTAVEFRKIQGHAPEYLKVMMEVLYCTAQRIGDILALEQTAITPGNVHIVQEKTGEPIDITPSPRLKDAIKKARSGPVVGRWLFTRHGKPYRYGMVRDAYMAAVKKAKVPHTTLHDIRAMAITDAKMMGRDAQKLAGHKDPKMTERYIREQLVDKVESL